MLTTLLAVGCGGFIGAISRYLISHYTAKATTFTYPMGTLLVNVIGCFAIGALTVFFERSASISPNLKLFLAVGVLGALTTFSTFGAETIHLAKANSFTLAAVNVFANMSLSLIAVVLGRFALKLAN
jgi:CrcB protein